MLSPLAWPEFDSVGVNLQPNDVNHRNIFL